MTLGIMAAYGLTHGITAAGITTGTIQDGTTHGTTAATGEVIGAGTIHGIIIIMVGMTHISIMVTVTMEI